jgi:hypothetical protein
MIFNFFLLHYASMILSKYEFTSFSLLFSLIIFSSFLSRLGLNYSYIELKRKAGLKPEKLLIYSILQIFSISLLFFFCSFFFITLIDLVTYIFAFFISVFQALSPSWIYNEKNNSYYYAKIILIPRLLFLMILFFTINGFIANQVDHNVNFFLGILLFSILPSTIYLLFKNLKKSKFYKITIENNILNFVNINMSYFGNMLLNNQVILLWFFFISLYKPSEAPYFVFIFQIVRLLNISTNIMSEVFANFFYDKDIYTSSRAVFFSILLILIACFPIYYIIDFLIALSDNYFLFSILPILSTLFFLTFIQAINKLINYPIISKIRSISFVHSVNYVFLFCHFIMMLFFIFYDLDYSQIPFILIFVSLIQLLFNFFVIVRK